MIWNRRFFFFFFASGWLRPRIESESAHVEPFASSCICANSAAIRKPKPGNVNIGCSKLLVTVQWPSVAEVGFYAWGWLSASRSNALVLSMASMFGTRYHPITLHWHQVQDALTISIRSSSAKLETMIDRRRNDGGRIMSWRAYDMVQVAVYVGTGAECVASTGTSCLPG
jgi:hypothetical protein